MKLQLGQSGFFFTTDQVRSCFFSDHCHKIISLWRERIDYVLGEEPAGPVGEGWLPPAAGRPPHPQQVHFGDDCC